MRVQLLPSNLCEPHRFQSLTTFLVDGILAIDGGSLGYALGPADQLKVRDVIITHTHNDHIATMPIFLAEVFPLLSQPITVYSTRESIAGLREHVFNASIWPDFHAIPLANGNGTALRYVEIEAGIPFELNDLKITPVWVNHVIPTVALVVESERATVLFTSDTYHTEEIWRVVNRLPRLDAVFVDVACPNEMESLAAASKHLTPQALNVELDKLTRPAQVYAVHLKPQFRDRVIQQLLALGRPEIAIAEIGREYVLGDEGRDLGERQK
jgi:ribonuclease BN (tRNA processing enzyme)